MAHREASIADPVAVQRSIRIGISTTICVPPAASERTSNRPASWRLQRSEGVVVEDLATDDDEGPAADEDDDDEESADEAPADEDGAADEDEDDED